MFPRVVWTVNESSHKTVKRIWSVVYLLEACYFPENSGTLLFRSRVSVCQVWSCYYWSWNISMTLVVMRSMGHDFFFLFRFIRCLNSSVYPGMNPVVQFQEGFQHLPNGRRLYETTWPVTIEMDNFWRLREWETSFSKAGKESQVIDFASFCHHQAAKFSHIVYKYQAIQFRRISKNIH